MSSQGQTPNLKPSTLEQFALNRAQRKGEHMNEQLHAIQEHWTNKKAINHWNLTYVIMYLSPCFQENEKKRLNELRTKFKRTNLYATVLSGINVFIVAAYFKSFLAFSNIKKVIFGVGVYFISYQLGMHYVKKDLKAYNVSLLEKYENEFVNKDFNK